MTIVEALIRLRDDLKTWVANNIAAKTEPISEEVDLLSTLVGDTAVSDQIADAINSQELFSGDYNDLENKPNITEDNSDNVVITDNAGNIIFKVDAEGVHTTAVKLNGEDVATTIEQHTGDTAIHVTEDDRSRWDNKSDFSGSYTDLTDAPNIAEDNSDNVIISDSSGNIVFRVDAQGVQTTAVTVGDGLDVETAITENAGDISALSGLVGDTAVATQIQNAVGAVNETLSQHTINTSNPHAVTYDQVGADKEGSATAVQANLDFHTDNADIHITQEERESWFSGDYNDLENKPNITEDNSDNIVVADNAGNIVVKIDGAGLQTVGVTIGELDVKSAITENQGEISRISSLVGDTSVKSQIEGAVSAAETGIREDLTKHTTDPNNPHNVTYTQVGADEAGTASNLVTAHNTATDAHADIREDLNTKSSATHWKNGTGAGAVRTTGATDATGYHSSAKGQGTVAAQMCTDVTGRYNAYTEDVCYPVDMSQETLYYSPNKSLYCSDTYTFDETTGEYTLTNPVYHTVTGIDGYRYCSRTNSSTPYIYEILSVDYEISSETDAETGAITDTIERVIISVFVLGSSNTANDYGDYVHIVGNGTGTSSRSNAHTLDWDGNAWFAGDVYVGSISGTDKDDGSVKLAKEGHLHDGESLNPRAIEFFPTTGERHGGHIDFHYEGDTTTNDGDYTSRIWEKELGKLEIEAFDGVEITAANIVTDGDIYVIASETPAMYVQNTTDNTRGGMKNRENQLLLASWNVAGDDSNYRLLSVNNSIAQSSVQKALRLTDRVDGVSTYYDILHTGNLADNLLNCGVSRVEFGTYTGDGTYGEDNPTSLTFDFEPKILFLGRPNFPSRATMLVSDYDAPTYTWMDFDGLYECGLVVTWSGNTVSWYTDYLCLYEEIGNADSEITITGSTALATSQFNRNNATQFYLAIG